MNPRGAAKTRREFIMSLGVGAAAVAAARATRGAEETIKVKQPNILMITCHDLGRHLGCYGVETVNSPNIDALARRGCRFSNYFATDSVCSPSRAVMLTGRYPQSNGLMGLTHAPWWWKYNEGERHLAGILKDAGYATTLIGLQHVTQGDPRKLGYDRVLSKRHKAPETVAAARKFLRDAKPAGEPFFAKIGFFEVHRAACSFKHRQPDTSKGVFIPAYLKDTRATRDDLARYQADIRQMDQYVGGILDALGESAVADNTLVIFTADHGIPYAGAKWSLRDAGLSIPLILHRPGAKFDGGKVFPQLMSNVDFLPTLLDLAGVSIPDNVEGVSFKGVLDGKTSESPRKYAFSHRVSHALRDNAGRGIRTDRYHLVRYFEPGRNVIYPTDVDPIGVSRHTVRPRRGGTRPFVQLFDIVADPDEFKDIARDPAHADVVRDLSKQLYAWMAQVDDPMLKGPIAKPYYKRAMEDLRKYK